MKGRWTKNMPACMCTICVYVMSVVWEYVCAGSEHECVHMDMYMVRICFFSWFLLSWKALKSPLWGMLRPHNAFTNKRTWGEILILQRTAKQKDPLDWTSGKWSTIRMACQDALLKNFPAKRGHALAILCTVLHTLDNTLKGHPSPQQNSPLKWV